jgi:hypothetical protein
VPKPAVRTVLPGLKKPNVAVGVASSVRDHAGSAGDSTHKAHNPASFASRLLFNITPS